MDIQSVLTLIEAVSNADIMNFQIEEGNFRLKMDKLTSHMEFTPIVDAKEENTAPAVKLDPMKLEETSTEEMSCVGGKEIKSPIVGTFYSAAGPDEADFVKVGDVVKKGQTLCIIEAMKLMNDIESDFDGEITEVLVNNEQMVEYGQPLYKIKVK